MSRTHTPDAIAINRARAIAGSLPEGELWLDGVATPLPEPVATMLREMLATFAQGEAVALITAESEMSPNEAAEFLNVSRGYITKLMDEGILPFRAVGAHRRIPGAAVAAHRARQDQISRAAMEELVGLSEELNLYTDPPVMPPKSVYRNGGTRRS
ncbi:MAG: helix-turn-helix domain-containing protein [Hyphomicrobiaceae bacterium]